MQAASHGAPVLATGQQQLALPACLELTCVLARYSLPAKLVLAQDTGCVLLARGTHEKRGMQWVLQRVPARQLTVGNHGCNLDLQCHGMHPLMLVDQPHGMACVCMRQHLHNKAPRQPQCSRLLSGRPASAGIWCQLVISMP